MKRPAALALVVLAALLLAAAGMSWYARAALVDEREFSARAAAALDDSDVRRALAGRLVGVATRSVAPDALAVRPVLVPVVAALADTPAFRRLFARALAQRHRALRDGETRFAFELPAGEGVVFDTIERFAPRLAAAIPPGLRVPVLRLDPREFELAGARALDDFSGWRWPLLLAALLAAAGAALLAGGTRAALVALGLIVSGAGLLVAVAVAGLGEFVVAHAAHAADLSDARERGAVRALWSALFSDLLTAGLLAALCGAVLAALAAQALPRIDLAGGAATASGRGDLAGAGGAAGARGRPDRARRPARARAGAGRAARADRRRAGRGGARDLSAAEPRRARAGRRAVGQRRARAPWPAPWRRVLVTALAVALLVLPGPEPVSFAVRDAGEQLQRLRGCVRAASRPGGLPRHPQLVCRGRGAGLVLRQPTPRDRAPAARRDPRLPDRRALRRARPAQRGGADVPEGRGLLAQQGGARTESRGAAHRRPARGPQPGRPARGRAARLPLPYALRAGRRAVRRAARAVRALPRCQPARGGDPLRGAVRARGRDRARPRGDGPARAGGRARQRRAAAHSAGADPRRHAPRGAGRAGRRRAALVPARLRPRPGHAARRHHAGRAALRALTAASVAARCSSSTTGSRPSRPRCPTTRGSAATSSSAGSRAASARRGLLPNLVAVDFYEQSGVVDAAKGLNE